jgi:hypothetical protein
MMVAAHLRACVIPAFQPIGAPPTAHDLIVEVERGQQVSVEVRTLSLNEWGATYQASVVSGDGLRSDVFAFVAVELPVCFVVPASDIPVVRRVSWQPPALRSNSRRCDAFDLDPYLMAFGNLWVGVAHGERFERRHPYIEEVRRRA